MFRRKVLPGTWILYYYFGTWIFSGPGWFPHPLDILRISPTELVSTAGRNSLSTVLYPLDRWSVVATQYKNPKPLGVPLPSRKFLPTWRAWSASAHELKAHVEVSQWREVSWTLGKNIPTSHFCCNVNRGFRFSWFECFFSLLFFAKNIFKQKKEIIPSHFKLIFLKNKLQSISFLLLFFIFHFQNICPKKKVLKRIGHKFPVLI